MSKLQPSVHTVLSSSTLHEGEQLSLELPPQLENYAEVKEALKMLECYWNRQQGTHIFSGESQAAKKRFEKALKTGELPPQNVHAFFATPPEIASKMAEQVLERFAWIADECDTEGVNELRILDPSAGTGALLDAIREKYDEMEAAGKLILQACEIDPKRRAVLQAKGYDVIAERFEDVSRGGYHAVVMNPPFTLKNQPQAWLDHLEHALKLVRPHGLLLAIVPNHTYFTQPAQDTRLKVLLPYEFDSEILPSGTFKDAGTNITTRLLNIELTPTWRSAPHQGFTSWHAWNLQLHIENSNHLSNREQEIIASTEGERANKLLQLYQEGFKQLFDQNKEEYSNLQISEHDLQDMVNKALDNEEITISIPKKAPAYQPALL